LHKSDLIQRLKDLGLTSYEARSYVSLASLGPSDIARVAAKARVPRTSAYNALDGLASKGWVDQVVIKPATYRAKKPADIKATLDSKIGETFQELEEMYSPQPAEEAELVYTLRGNDRVLTKFYEMLRGAKSDVVLVAPTMGLQDARLLGLLQEAIERGVKVRAIGDEEAAGVLPPGAEIRTGNLVAIDLLVDDKMAMIALPDYSACGWVDSPAVAENFKQFLELLWSTSSPA
jgi:HTH-type transcriptional regulator, sugar sensing transcriptional regulator